MSYLASSLQGHIIKGIGYPKLPYETVHISDIALLTDNRKTCIICKTYKASMGIGQKNCELLMK
jgi:hypothetical protein